MARSGSAAYAAITVVVCLIFISAVSGTGNFFVGLLKYDNTGNLDNAGKCCDGNPGPGGTCAEVCDLIFDITVTSLGRNPQTRRWSNEPVSGESISSFSHPVSFNFTRWPGEVNVTVNIYDSDDDINGTQPQMVDQFQTVFTHQGTEIFYILQPLKGQRSINASLLTILFRYKCDATLGPHCFTDCMDHMDNETCPTPPPFTGTFQTATDPYCDQPDNKSGNCSAIPVTTDSHINTTISTKRVYHDSGNISANHTTMTNQIFSNTNGHTTPPRFSSLTDTASTPSVKIATTTPFLSTESTTITKTVSESKKTKPTTNIVNVSVQETIPGTSLTTTVDPPLGTPPTVYEDEGMDYWPAIVGGVLGGLALLAAAGFLVYYKRQKKLQKRQEIYNVNPKILRQFEEYAENGTSGRADVPLETEQV